ncbi:hypothetical protein B9J78_06710 [bacterium Unc6]|nr:hypothetical protein [bacterium Unc6]
MLCYDTQFSPNSQVVLKKLERLCSYKILGIILNRYQKRGIVEETNPQVIEEMANLKVFGVIPGIDDICLNSPRLGRGVEILGERLTPSLWSCL